MTAIYVSAEQSGEICVIAIDNPPVNALSQPIREQLLVALKNAQANPNVRAILILGVGQHFIGGADIGEFGRAPLPPLLPQICERIETARCLTVAALHGVALGGGLEIALAAHYRIASMDARVGLPEVKLGLLPGAGGTQRTPRLAGAATALELMLGGDPINAERALAAGLVDKVVRAPLREAALAYVGELLQAAARPRRSRDGQRLSNRAAAQAAIDAARARMVKDSPRQFAPGKIVEAVQAALDLPFEQGLAFERQAFQACMESPQRAALIHMFFAERAVAKPPRSSASPARPLHRIGVVGGGTMGAGIAVAILDSGLPLTMIERDPAALAQGRANVEKIYDRLIAKGRISAPEKATVMARFVGSTDYATLAETDLVIEAVFEDMSIKKAVFAELDRVCKATAILASNTSYLDIDELADATRRPEDIIGLHFFSPANIMRLLEVVTPAKVAPDVVATALALAHRLRKIPVRAKVCDGFIGNRILAAYRQAADTMMEDGASPYQIDAALQAFGYPMGPYQVIDLAGGDIGWATRKRRAATRDPNLRYVEIADRLCERGWFGQKSGRGFYRYLPHQRNGLADPEVESIVRAERQRAGVTPRYFSDGEIVRRYLAAMINEGANVLEEGVAEHPLDIDVVLVNGYGFPRYRGGPMFHADRIGLKSILADICSFAREDPTFWKPSPLLERLVAEGRRFEDLNRLH